MAINNLNLIGKVNPGTNPQSAGMTFKTDAPLDDRCAVINKASLISTSAFESNAYMYPGMAVAVVKSGDMYILTNPDPTTITLYTDELIETRFSSEEKLDEEIAKHWKKLASASDISGLSGVFTFKGVAEAVSSDLKYIAICSDISDQSIVPIGTAVDLVGDLYYGWSIDGNEFWTDSSILDSTKQQYVRGQAVKVWGVKYKDEFYFPVTDVMPTGGDDEYIELQNSNKDSIFLLEGSYPTTQDYKYLVYDNEGKDIGEGVGFSYTGYEFYEITTPHTISNTHTMILANEDNSGHVYQIEDNEYASNGQIWVKLGSPVDDWIVIE